MPSEPTPHDPGTALTTASARELGFPVDGEFDSLEPENAFGLRRLLAAVLRYKWLIALITVIGSAGGYMLARRMGPEYSAQATVWIQAPASPRQSSGQGIQPIQPTALLASQAWLDLLLSHTVLDSVVMAQRLYLRNEQADAPLFAGLTVAPEFRAGHYRLVVEQTGGIVRLETRDGAVLERVAAGSEVGRGYGMIWRPEASELRAGRRADFSLVQKRAASRALADQLDPRLDAQGSFLRVGLNGPNPQRIAATVNAVTERFVEVSAELKRDRVEEVESILAQQVSQAGDYLRAADSAYEAFRVRTITMPASSESENSVHEQFFDMRFELDELRRDRQQIARVLQELEGGAEVPVLALELLASVNASSELKGVLAQLTELRAELRTARRQYTDEHETNRRLIDQIAGLEQRTVPVLLGGLVRRLDARDAELAARIARTSQELTDIPSRESEEARLQRHLTSANNLYSQLLGRYEEARVAAATAIPDMSILDRATPPRSPVSDRRRQILLLAIFGSFGLALATAIGADRIDPRLRYPEQVTELGLVTLGAVPHVRLGTGPKQTASRELAIEAFRAIRMNVAHAAGSATPLLITVSSPGPGEGKSFVSMNLAQAFAESGHRTLLIDGDVRRGALHDTLTARRTPGLTNFLLGQAGWDEIVQPTANPLLSLIACGTRQRNAPELLGGKVMGELLSSALQARYAVIIMDSPPLIAGVDPLVLATWTRSLLLVLRTGNTNRELAELKLEGVHRLPIRLLGAVLNDVPQTGAYRYYSYVPGYELVDDESDASPRALAGVASSDA